MAIVKLDDIERRAFKSVYNHKCYICDKFKTPGELEIDHIIPPKKREEAINMGVIDKDFKIDSYDNYAPSCSSCNNKKFTILGSTPQRVIIFLEIANQKLSKVKSEVEKLRKKYEKERNEEEIQIIVNQWDKLGYFKNPKILNLLSEKVNQYTKQPVTYISLRTESAIEVVGNKLIKEYELDNFITKIQTSQEMIFGYGNSRCLALEEGIQFYPLSIYRSHIRFHNRELLTQNQKELIFILNFYAVLLKDNKAVLISISNVDVGFKNLDYKEEIEPSDQLQLPLLDKSNPIHEIIRQRYYDRKSYWGKIRRSLLELINVSRIVMQYIRELFKDVNQ